MPSSLTRPPLQRLWFERAATGSGDRAHVLTRSEWDATWALLHDECGDESVAELLATLFDVQDAGGSPGGGAEDDALADASFYDGFVQEGPAAPHTPSTVGHARGESGQIYRDFTAKGGGASALDVTMSAGGGGDAPPLATPFTILRPAELERKKTPPRGGAARGSPGADSATSASLAVTRYRFHMLGRSEWLTNDAAVALYYAMGKALARVQNATAAAAAAASQAGGDSVADSATDAPAHAQPTISVDDDADDPEGEQPVLSVDALIRQLQRARARAQETAAARVEELLANVAELEDELMTAADSKRVLSAEAKVRGGNLCGSFCRCLPRRAAPRPSDVHGRGGGARGEPRPDARGAARQGRARRGAHGGGHSSNVGPGCAPGRARGGGGGARRRARRGCEPAAGG